MPSALHFELKEPCAQCPFRSDKEQHRGWLHPERVREITDAILKEDKTFTCHKTLGHTREQMCAGALRMIEAADQTESPFGNAAVQIAERLGLYDPQTLTRKVPVFPSQTEMVAFHGDEPA